MQLCITRSTPKTKSKYYILQAVILRYKTNILGFRRVFYSFFTVFSHCYKNYKENLKINSTKHRLNPKFYETVYIKFYDWSMISRRKVVRRLKKK